MLSRLITLALLACLGLASPAAALAQDALPPRLEQARVRWEELTPQERQTVRKNYRRWKAMSEDERAELRRRADQLKAEREQVERELPADVKRDLSKLDGGKQRQVLRDLTEERVKETGRRLRSKMPQDFVRDLEQAPVAERPELLRRFKRQQRGRVTRAAIETLGAQLDLPAGEVRRMQELPEDQRARAVLELRQRLAGAEQPEAELPLGLTWDQWDEWSRLPPDRFFRRIVDFRRDRLSELRRGHREPRAVGAPREEPAVARAPESPEGDGRRPERVADATPELRPAGRDDPLPRVLRRLAQAISPDPRDALELIELSRPERQEGMARRRRKRCMELIQGEHLLPEERVRQLDELPNEEFFDLVRRILVHTGHLGPALTRAEVPAEDEPLPR